MRKGETLNYRLGQVGVNYQNVPMKIIRFRKTNDIDVLFMNGAGEIVKTRYSHFKSGKIRCFSNVVGEEKLTKHGEKVTVVGIVGDGHKEIIIKYLDESTLTILRKDYIKGVIPCRKKRKRLEELISKGSAKMIPKHIGYYADINGNIYNSDGHILKPQKIGGYYGVDLRMQKGVFKRFLVHRLVLSAFIPNVQNKEQVNHKDGDKHNNSLDNLEWATSSENQKHRFTVLNHTHRGEHNTRAKLKDKDVMEIIMLKKKGIGVSELSRKFNVCVSAIYKILSGRRWIHISYDESNLKNEVLAL